MKNITINKRPSHKSKNLTTWCGFTGRWGTKHRRGGFERSICSTPISSPRKSSQLNKR